MRGLVGAGTVALVFAAVTLTRALCGCPLLGGLLGGCPVFGCRPTVGCAGVWPDNCSKYHA